MWFLTFSSKKGRTEARKPIEISDDTTGKSFDITLSERTAATELSTSGTLQSSSIASDLLLEDQREIKDDASSSSSLFRDDDDASLSSHTFSSIEYDELLPAALEYPTRDHTKVVNFAHVFIRTHCMCLADNPSTKEGPPVGLDWEYDDLPILSVNQFEILRKRTRKTCLSDLILPALYREQLLTSLGFSRAEQVAVTKAVQLHQKKQQSRRYSSENRNSFLMPFESAMGSVREKLTRRRRQRHQVLVWTSTPNESDARNEDQES